MYELFIKNIYPSERIVRLTQIDSVTSLFVLPNTKEKFVVMLAPTIRTYCSSKTDKPFITAYQSLIARSGILLYPPSRLMSV